LLQEVAFVDSASVFAEIHRRLDSERWLTEIIRGRDGVLRLASIRAEIALGSLYEFVELEEPERSYLPE
jgi:hypothetical protein